MYCSSSGCIKTSRKIVAETTKVLKLAVVVVVVVVAFVVAVVD